LSCRFESFCCGYSIVPHFARAKSALIFSDDQASRKREFEGAMKAQQRWQVVKLQHNRDWIAVRFYVPELL